MQRCKALNDYAYFVALVRRLQKELNNLTMAVNLAVEECIRNNVLVKFLQENRAEVVDMWWCEYNEEEHIASEKELSRAEGKVEGKVEGIIELLEELGKVSEELRKTITEQKDTEVLKSWLKLAAKADTLEGFQDSIRQ